MDLIKAKEILIININEAGKKMPADILTALIIGQASIVRICSMRSYGIQQAILPLKGETERGGRKFPDDTLKRLRESPLGIEPRA